MAEINESIRSKKLANIKQLQLELDELEDDRETEEEPIKIEKEKKPRTEKQVEAYKRACLAKAKNAEVRKKERLLKEAEDKKILEEKIVKKAIVLKKKQIAREKVLDIEEDEEIQAPVRVPNHVPIVRKKVAPIQSKYKYY